MAQSLTPGKQQSDARPFQFTRLDRVVCIAVLILLLLIAGTILLGDHVGVEVVQVAPQKEAHTTSPITIHFKEPMDASSVAAHFRTKPALKGTFSWNESTMTFRATPGMKPGSEYT